MPFNSLIYFLFLPLVYFAFYFSTQRTRWMILLAASLVFYAALNVPYLLVVLTLVAVTTFGVGLRLHNAESPTRRRRWLWGGIVTNVMILITIKYLPFLAENVRLLSSLFSLELPIQPLKALVAIGVSFYVFQAISYLFDIYNRVAEPERHFGYFALYLAFFPKLLQGPIERGDELIPQLERPYAFDYDDMRMGMLLIAWGLFKKVVIANRLGVYVDAVYGDVHSFSGLPLLMATYAYAIQIYMDFSGYTDIALGSARLFNIRLTPNFNSPYFATSIIDFWRRWHITFSRWIFGYIFNPLQLRWHCWGIWSTPAALMVTFFISGIWHGASWGFVIWGMLHGVCMSCSALYRPFQKKLHRALKLEKRGILKVWQTVITFNLVTFLWIFFRSSNIGDAFYVIRNLLPDASSLTSAVALRIAAKPFFERYGFPEMIIVGSALLVYWAMNLVFRRPGGESFSLASIPRYRRWIVYYVLAIGIAFFGSYNALSNFIYFQF